MNVNELDDLKSRLKSALPPTDDGSPSRDLWLSVRARMHESPRLSMLDLALAAAAALALWFVPEAWLALLYHL
jgi:hypothetical protein